MKSIKKHLFLFFLALLASNCCNSQDSFSVQRIQSAVVLDGKDSEDFWKDISSFPMTRQSPDYLEVPSERTEIKLAYDDKNLYVMAKLYSESAANVQNYSLQRDGDCPCDWIGFAIGGDGASPPSGFGFATTPSGLRWDSFLVDGSGGISLDASFNTFWNVATTIDPAIGWIAEFAIPWSSLRFSDKNAEEIMMDFVLWRKITYNNEFVVYPNIPPNWGVLSFAKLSKGQKLYFKGIKSSRPLYAFPYALGGGERDQILNSTGDQYKPKDNFKKEIGIDFKYNITNNLTVDATINTDFAQVEADNVQINLGRASLFFPEKREFFLERKDKFDFGFSSFNPVNANVNNAFYSRRIGLEAGSPSRIFGGGRLVGRAGKLDVGVLNMVTESNDDAHLQNMGLIRLKRQLFGPNTYVGGIYTSILKDNGQYNHLLGTDALLELFKDNFLKLAIAQSRDDANNKSTLDQTRYDVRLERRIERGLFYSLSHGLVGDKYLPGLGFEERGSRWNNSYRLGYGIFPDKSEKIFRHIILSNGWLVNSYNNWNLESVYFDAGYTMERKNGSGFTIKPIYQKENLLFPLFFTPTVNINPGSYEFASGQIAYLSPSIYSLNANSSIAYGNFYDGKKTTFTAFVRWDASRFFKLTANYQNDKVDFEHRGGFTNNLLGLNILVMFNTKFSISSLVQYNALNNRVGSNVRFRYNPSERRDLYIVINNGLNTETQQLGVELPRAQYWNIQVKYTHAITFNRK
jgi:hypothetical protein